MNRRGFRAWWLRLKIAYRHVAAHPCPDWRYRIRWWLLNIRIRYFAADYSPCMVVVLCWGYKPNRQLGGEGRDRGFIGRVFERIRIVNGAGWVDVEDGSYCFDPGEGIDLWWRDMDGGPHREFVAPVRALKNPQPVGAA